MRQTEDESMTSDKQDSAVCHSAHKSNKVTFFYIINIGNIK